MCLSLLHVPAWVDVVNSILTSPFFSVLLCVFWCWLFPYRESDAFRVLLHFLEDVAVSHVVDTQFLKSIGDACQLPLLIGIYASRNLIIGGNRSLCSTPAASLALSRVRATAVRSAFLPLNMDRCASSASGTDNNHDGTSLQVASCSLQNPALQLPVAYQGLEQDAAATMAATGGEPAVFPNVADRRSMCSESAMCMSCGGPVGRSQDGNFCDECRDMFVALPSEREQQSPPQQGLHPQQPQLGEDGSDDGGSVSQPEQQADSDCKPVQGMKALDY